jgi:hypothetical protein
MSPDLREALEVLRLFVPHQRHGHTSFCIAENGTRAAGVINTAKCLCSPRAKAAMALLTKHGISFGRASTAEVVE